MQKLTYIIFAITVFNILSMQGMEKETSKTEEYNNSTCLLTSLPNELLIKIFSHCLVDNNLSIEFISFQHFQSLEKNIKNFMRMNTTCKKFNKLLTFETIGEFCKNYDQHIKDAELIELIKKTRHSCHYKRMRLPILILLCAGANYMRITSNEYLLEYAVQNDDAHMIKILFEHHHADPNQKWLNTPIFFNINTIEIARIFLDNKDFNVHAIDGNGQNVLWTVTDNYCTVDLLTLYLGHGVDATGLNSEDNSCLLHLLTENLSFYEKINVYGFLKKGKLLLDVMPNMVNTLTIYDHTPLDFTQIYLKLSQSRDNSDATLAYNKFIALLRKHGGKTGKEIREETMILLLHADDHLGELSMLPRHIRKYIVEHINALHKQIR